ncbi:MAG: M20/M25/M40 family metallo-hydrolase [Bacillota bacterium]
MSEGKSGDVNEKRLVDSFIGLVKLDSPSKKEKRVAEYLQAQLRQLGLEVRPDDAGSTFGGEAGNLHAALKGSESSGGGAGPGAKGRTPLLCAHMDTVRAAPGLEPQVRDGVIHSDGRNILAADDKAGVAAILEALAVVKETGRPHGEVGILFTVGEEIGLFGARGADKASLAGDFAFVFDSGSEVGTIIVDTPTEIDLTIMVTGRTAHAGVEPEKGVNAIHVAAKGMAALPTGRLDPETTLNFGVIRGGTATNIVPEHTEI